jgi:hypothetical protein
MAAETYACSEIVRLREAGIDQCAVIDQDARRFGDLQTSCPALPARQRQRALLAPSNRPA